MHEVSLNINPIYCRKLDVDSATMKKLLKVLRTVWICHRWRILQIFEIHYIVDHVNIVRVNIEDRHSMGKVYTLAMDSIAPGLLLFLIKKNQNWPLTRKRHPHTFPALENLRMTKYHHGNTGDNVDHRGGYTDSSGLFKENVWILEKNKVWTEKTRTWLQQ